MCVRPFSFAALVLAFAFAFPMGAHADDAARETLARELMVVTGAGDLGKQVIEGMSAQLSGNATMASFLEKFVELAKPDELVELVVPLYVKAFDEETLQAAVDFYNTPAGKKMVAATPQLTQESMALGQAWGMKLAKQAQEAVDADKAAAGEAAGLPYERD